MANWNFEDFLRRLEAIKEMGSIDEIVAQVPALAAILREVDFRIEELEPIERILRAMTLEERLHPESLEGDEGRDKRERVAETSGSSLEAVESLIWNFQHLRQLLKGKSPEQVTEELLETMQPKREAWQASADSWKDVPGFVPLHHDDDEPSLELAPEPLKVADAWGEDWQEQLDEVLRKMASDGADSLTADEREFLDGASKRYRARRG